MAKCNMLPNNVFTMQMDAKVCYKRAAAGDANQFGNIGDIIKQRI